MDMVVLVTLTRIVQEDYWVQRELLRIIRDANDSVAKFHKSKTPPKPKAAPVEKKAAAAKPAKPKAAKAAKPAKAEKGDEGKTEAGQE